MTPNPRIGICLICRQDGEPLLKTDCDDSDEVNKLHKSWATTCVRSLCSLIKVPDFQYLFLNASYCETCLQLIRDIDFNLQQINNFQKQILGFRDHIFTEFRQNYEVNDHRKSQTGARDLLLLDLLSYDEKVKIVYRKINEGSKCWTGTDFMDPNPPRNHKIILQNIKIEAINNDENEPMQVHEEQKAEENKEEFILPDRPKRKQNILMKEEPLDEQVQDLDITDLNEDNDPNWRCLDAEEESNVFVPELVFGFRDVLEVNKIEVNEDDEPIELDKEEENIQHNESRPRRKRNEVSYKEPSGENKLKEIPQDIDLNEDHNDTDWKSSDSDDESELDNEDNFALGPSNSNKSAGKIIYVKECTKEFQCEFSGCGRGFDLKRNLLAHQRRVHEGDSNPYHCELCERKYKNCKTLLFHVSRDHTPKCSFCGMEFKTQEEQDEHENIHKNSDQPFKCTITNCDQVFPNSTALKQHMFVHFDNRLKCDVCDKRFKSAHYLSVHQKIHDDSFVGFPCTVCNKICANPTSLASHMDTHSNERKYSCDVCGATFKIKASLYTHKRIHSEAKYICKICGKGFSLADHLKAHEETHSGTLYYECKICEKKFAGKRNLMEHEARHDPSKKRKKRKEKLQHCEVCNKTFQSSSNFAAHKKTHRNTAAVSCLECNKEFKYEESLKMHMARDHLMKCKFCAMTCETKELLDEHENVHKNKDQPFTCTICDEVFTNSSRLKQHMLTHAEGRAMCDVCGKSFQTLKYLRRHRKMHDESFVGHVCKVCNKKCVTAYVLEQHMEQHSDKKKYVCEICGSAYQQDAALKRHKRTHEEEFKFVCQFCGKRFSSSQLLKSHEEIHSGTLSYECKICQKKFRAFNNLRQHLKTHEPKDPNTKKRTRIRPNQSNETSNAKSSPKKVKAKGNRSSLKYADSSSSECESEEDYDEYLMEEDAKKSDKEHLQKQQALTTQYPSSSSTQQFQSEYNMPNLTFQYPTQ